MALSQAYLEWEARTKQQARQEGRQEGQRVGKEREVDLRVVLNGIFIPCRQRHQMACFTDGVWSLANRV